jgi:hypothetical protein
MIAALFSRFPNIADLLPGDTAPSRNLLPAHGATYSQLLADRANAQAAYDALSRYPRSTPAKHASQRLLAATCAVIAYEVKQ